VPYIFLGECLVFGILVIPMLVITVVFLVFSCDIPAETYQYVELLVLCMLFILFTLIMVWLLVF
jgi:hypothetical protein